MIRLMSAILILVIGSFTLLIGGVVGQWVAGIVGSAFLYLWTGFLLWIVCMPDPPTLWKILALWFPATLLDHPEWLK